MQTVHNSTVTKHPTRGFASRPEFINKNGRPSNPEKRLLLNALREAKKENKGVEFLHFVAREAYKDKSVMLAVFDKLVPNAQLPKEDNENAGIKQLIIIRSGEAQAVKDVPRQVHLQPEEVSSDVEFMGNGKDHVVNISGYAIQRASTEQPGSDLS